MIKPTLLVTKGRNHNDTDQRCCCTDGWYQWNNREHFHSGTVAVEKQQQQLAAVALAWNLEFVVLKSIKILHSKVTTIWFSLWRIAGSLAVINCNFKCTHCLNSLFGSYHFVFCPMAHSGTGINHSTQLLQRKRLWRSMKRRKTLAIFAAIYYKIAVLLILDKGEFHVFFFHFPWYSSSILF